MQALSYMGYNISLAHQEQIRARLDISEDGRVVFADFVNLAKELFAFKLDDAHLEANLVYALTQKDSLDMPPMPRKVNLATLIIIIVHFFCRSSKLLNFYCVTIFAGYQCRPASNGVQSPVLSDEASGLPACSDRAQSRDRARPDETEAA